MGRKQHKNMPFMCGACKAGFGSDKAVRLHIGDAHPKAQSVGVYRRTSHVDGPDYEPSVGEELADALLAARCGESVPEHIALMFPDEIAEARRR